MSKPNRCEYPFKACEAVQERDALRASLAAAEAKLADEVRHADALAEHMQSLQDAGYEFHAPDNCERVDALLAAHAARRAGTTAVEREEGKR